MNLNINRRNYTINVERDTPLVWVIREYVGLTGTKFGCGIGVCGACSVLVNGQVVRSCITPVGDVIGKEIITVEGIPPNHPVKRAWVELQVAQCGYCQPGQIITAYALLLKNPRPDRRAITSAMSGNLCRCGTYPRIIKAVEYASKLLREKS